MEKTSKDYWNNVWKNNTIPQLFNINSKLVNDYSYIELHKIFTKVFKSLKGKKIKILEIGCANSIWPVYFNKYWDFDVYGLDYSEDGCVLERKILKHYGIDENRIYCTNLFEPPEELIGVFDVVISFGVIEHFSNTSATLNSFTKYLKPKGILFTEIPNMNGITGIIQKFFNKEIYNIHVPLDIKLLTKAHIEANLSVRKCEFFIFYNYSVPNIENIKNTLIYYIIKFIGKKLTMISFWVNRNLFLLNPNKITSPYLYCLSLKN